MKLKKTAIQILLFSILYIYSTGISTCQIVNRERILNRPLLNLNLGKHLALHIPVLNTHNKLNTAKSLLSYNLKLSDHLNLNIPLQDADSKAYRKAYKLILEKKWEEALKAMQEFVKDYPKSSRVSSAEYWTCYACEKLDYPLIEVFDKYDIFVKKYPGSRWADDARSNMIRIGMILSETGRKEYLTKVIELREDNNEIIALTALYALGTKNEKKTLPVVIDMYNKTENSDIRRQIVNILIRFESEPAANKLLEIARFDKDPMIRKTAISFVKSKKPEETLEIIKDIIWNSDDKELQKNVVYYLSSFKGRKYKFFLHEIIKSHKDPYVRSVAINILSDETAKNSEILKTLENIILNEENIELVPASLLNPKSNGNHEIASSIKYT